VEAGRHRRRQPLGTSHGGRPEAKAWEGLAELAGHGRPGREAVGLLLHGKLHMHKAHRQQLLELAMGLLSGLGP
jgi:hypothetical protein